MYFNNRFSRRGRKLFRENKLKICSFSDNFAPYIYIYIYIYIANACYTDLTTLKIPRLIEKRIRDSGRNTNFCSQ